MLLDILQPEALRHGIDTQNWGTTIQHLESIFRHPALLHRPDQVMALAALALAMTLSTWNRVEPKPPAQRQALGEKLWRLV